MIVRPYLCLDFLAPQQPASAQVEGCNLRGLIRAVAFLAASELADAEVRHVFDDRQSLNVRPPGVIVIVVVWFRLTQIIRGL